MTYRRPVRLLLIVLAVLVAIGSTLMVAVPRLLLAQGIEVLDWRGAAVNTAGVRLAQLNLRRHSEAGTLALTVEGLHLGWAGFGLQPPFWQTLDIGRAHLDWQPTPTPVQASSDRTLDLGAVLASLALLPAHVQINALSADVPCPRGRCRVDGSARLARPQDTPGQLMANLEVHHQQHRLSVQLNAQQRDQAMAAHVLLSVDDEPQLSLRSDLSPLPAGTLWQGEISTLSFTQAALVQAWLAEWLPVSARPSAVLEGTAQLNATWQLHLAEGPLNLTTLHTLSGRLEAAANLPQAWALPGVGEVQGDVQVTARAEQGTWLIEQLHSDLQLDGLALADWLPTLPAALNNPRLSLRIAPAPLPADLPANLSGRALPLQVEISSSGASALQVKATLAVATHAPWAVQIAHAQLTAATARLDMTDWQGRDIRAQLNASGYLDSTQLRLAFGSDSQLQMAQLDGAGVQAQGLRAQSDNLQLSLDYPDSADLSWQVEGPLGLRSERLTQANLKPQSWNWQGQLKATDEQQQASGRLNAQAEMPIDLMLRHSRAEGLRLEAKAAELFLRAGNPLAQILADWPALLDLSAGRLNTQASLTLPTGSSTPQVNLDLALSDISGLYDRATFSGLSGDLHLRLDARTLSASSTNLRLAEVDPGVAIGPTQLSARYQAPRNQPGNGTLSLERAETRLIEGRLSLAPGQWRLSDDDWLLPLRLEGLNLDRLLTLYPADGLAGSGLIDGDLPLRVQQGELSIAQGQLAARAPGGYLRFRSARFDALGRSNPAMQLVTRSLEDFRYSVLSSQVDYDRLGKLNLGLRLEGQNPAIEGGRPIHFNINLEEDIPTLLASLQLTDKVNEIITQRVQRYMLERNAQPSTSSDIRVDAPLQGTPP